jgi:F-type H+-transporting ATPase subunit b
MRILSLSRCREACETERKRAGARAIFAAAAVATALIAMPAAAFAQADAPQPAPEPPGIEQTVPTDETHAAEEAHAAEAEHAGGAMEVVARLINFAVLAGTLIYLLRSPFGAYLASRGAQIRSDLVSAAEMKETASAQIAEIDRRMAALPGELESLRAQGAREIAAEERRIRAAAAAERDRLLEQARRDIDQQVKIAERELVNRAADLAVGVAAERIRTTITDEDQKRLADRYVQQLKR